MQHLNLVSISPSILQNKLLKMKELQQSIKVLEAELAMLKSHVIDSYFCDNEEFKTEKGLVLATYKSFEMNVFNQSKFKNDFQETYKIYSEIKTISKFLLK